ncbi:MAG: PAS domain S-box protein [Pyrinomonadaceae bacterium]
MANTSIGKILIVDDEVELKNILVEALTSQGYETSGFTSGEDALAAFRTEAFDVLLTDLMMPGMDGIALVGEALKIDPHVVAIVMTGQGTIQTAVDAMKGGAFDYVLKPFRLQTVMPVLTRAMNTRHIRLENLQLRETVAIYELSQTIAFTLDRQTIVSKLADAALQQTDADEVSVLFPTEDGDELYVAAVRGENRQKLLGERVPLHESISSWVVHERTPLILDGEVNDERFRALWPRPEIRSAISIPMQVANKLIGTININALDRTRPFTLGQVKALTILANTAAAALESASLYGQVQRAEENYRSIFENAVEGVFQSTPEGRFITVNPAMARILGYDSAEEMIEMITDVSQQFYVSPADGAAAARLQEDRGKIVGFEFQALRKDGQTICLSLNRRSVYDENGRELYREGTIEDITERKRSEDALRASQQLIEGIINAIPVRIFWKDKNLVYLGCNAAFARDAGFADPKDIIGKDDYQLAWRDQAEMYRADDRHVIESGSSRLLFEESLTTPEGLRTLLSSKVPLRNSTGEISGILGTFMDITERKRLEEQRELLSALVQASPDFIGYADAKTAQILYINKHGRSMCGIGEDEELGELKISDVHPAWMNQRMEEVILPAAVRDGLWEGDGAFLNRDGSEIPVSMLLLARKTANGEVDLFYTVSRDITERKRTEEALKSSEAEMRALFASMNDLIMVIDSEGRYLKVAPTKPHHMYRRDTARVGKTLHEIFPTETADFFLNEIRAALETGSTRRIEYSLTIGDGDFWFDGSISPMTESTVVWVARDITERKLAEEERATLAAEIESQRQRLDNMVATVPGVVWEAWGQPDAATQRINFVSDYVERMLGYTVEEWLSTPNFWLQIVHPDDRERVAKQSADAFGRTEAKAMMEFRWVRKDGVVLWVESISTVVADDAGRPLGMRGVTTDISERRRAEEALRESEERYRDLVENAHDIIYSHDLEGNYTSVNKAGQVTTGYTREEALKLNMADTVAPEWRDKAKDMMRRKLAGERVTAYEMELLAKDGRRVAVEVNTKLVYANGKPVAVQGIARDVTERKQLEDQLRQSQKMEAIGQLAGGVAHDFNNLLTAIIGYSGLALQRIEDESPLKPYIEEIKKAGDRAANLTRQLLAFGRKQILQPLPLNLNDVITDLNKMLRRLIGEDIRLAARLDLDLKKIKADPGQIEQVLMNLVVNARDAMPRGGSLTIETANIQIDEEYAGRHIGVSPGAYVMLAVSDNGTGMDHETQAKLFEPFFTTKEKGKGTGLGLSTVYGIVKQSGGNIWVYSELGHGSTFKIYLPQVDDPVRTAQTKLEDDSIPGGSETVLLVEDEDVVRGLAQRILEEAGYRVITAHGGEEAVTWCANNAETIHLLLTDVVMPETSGKELAERLTSLRPQTKVLFMSGYTDEAIVHHGVLDSNVEFIQKPFTPTALSRKVRQVLDSNGLKLSSGEN